MTVWLLAGMTTELVVPVLLSLAVPVQPVTAQPLAGSAVRLMPVPGLYWPAGQPVELGGAAIGLLPWPVCCRLSV